MPTQALLSDPGHHQALANATEEWTAGRARWQGGDWEAAECHLRRAVELDPGIVDAWNCLGLVRQRRGDLEHAAECFRAALTRDPTMIAARRNLAMALVRLGDLDGARPLWGAEWRSGREGVEWMQGLASRTMQAGNLPLASSYAALVAEQRWGVGLRPPDSDGGVNTDPPGPHTPTHPLSVPKLRDDVGQFRLLLDRQVLGPEYEDVLDRFQRVLSGLEERGEDARCPLDSEEYRSISDAYNRLHYRRWSPRVGGALAGSWDRAEVQARYLADGPGVVWIDDFLSEEALSEVREFCLESTVWSTNRYAHGRIGSFFQDGFNSPLLMQIAEELQSQLPRVIGRRYPLRQVWGFKSGPTLPAEATTHADFAAVNVNFWITPDDANLDPSCGGLVVYDVDAPMHWDFATYNGRGDLIRPYLRAQGSRALVIPYRANRAIIFNSDLFHATDRVAFRDGYANRRVNITMLFGDRENDQDHQGLVHVTTAGGAVPAWRSAAFRRTRARTPPGRAS